MAKITKYERVSPDEVEVGQIHFVNITINGAVPRNNPFIPCEIEKINLRTNFQWPEQTAVESVVCSLWGCFFTISWQNLALFKRSKTENVTQ